MKKYLLYIFISGVFYSSLNAQMKFEANGSFELELSKGGENSHFYYNGIHSNYKNWRLAPSEASLILNVLFNENWSFNSRLLLNRLEGKGFNNLRPASFNLLWVSKSRKHELSIGRFINPFGSFNHNQLPKDRSLIDLPLSYSFYTNISQKAGYLQGQKWNTILVDGNVDWGSSTLYYGGYSDGIKFLWNINPDKSFLEIAIVNGANLNKSLNTSPINLGFSSRYSYRSSSELENGISFSIGNFLENHPLNASLSSLSYFTQTMVGLDFKYGQGFFEITSEIIGSFYKTPFIISNDGTTIDDLSGNKLLSSYSAYLDLKYEPSFLPGSYLVYRIEGIYFGKDQELAWDENVLRHTLGFGYKITTYLLLRSSYSYQIVKSHSWDQTAFRTGISAYF